MLSQDPITVRFVMAQPLSCDRRSRRVGELIKRSSCLMPATSARPVRCFTHFRPESPLGWPASHRNRTHIDQNFMIPFKPFLKVFVSICLLRSKERPSKSRQVGMCHGMVRERPFHAVGFSGRLRRPSRDHTGPFNSKRDQRQAPQGR